MFYRIGDVTLVSPIELPSYTAFRCEPSEADVTLETACGILLPGGEDIIRDPVAVRKTEKGWFYHLPTADQSGLLVSGDYKKLRLLRNREGSVSGSEEWFIRLALECLLAHRGFVSLHAACIELDGQAIAFTGPSGTGKSTRAAAWMEAFGAKLLSGDRPLIRADGKEAFGVPWDGKEGCYRNARLPLLAIFDIRRSPSAYIRAMSLQQKRRLLMKQCFLPMWDSDTAALQMLNIARLASKARIVRIFSGPETKDALALKSALEAGLEYKEAAELKAKKELILRELADEYVVFPIGKSVDSFSKTFLLNETAAFIWQKLQTPLSFDDLLKAIVDTYDVEEAKARADLDDILNQFRAMNMITEDD